MRGDFSLFGRKIHGKIFFPSSSLWIQFCFFFFFLIKGRGGGGDAATVTGELEPRRSEVNGKQQDPFD